MLSNAMTRPTGPLDPDATPPRMWRFFHPLMIPLLGAGLMLLTSCGNSEESPQQSATPSTHPTDTITVGFGPSTYINQFENGVKPILEAQGYRVETKTFSQNSMIPAALKEGAIDASVHISTANMIEMNRRLDADMIVWADTPSAPQSLRSLKHQTLDAIQDGMSVGLPNDPVNLERAVRILEDLDWVEIPPDLEIATFHINSVTPKKYALKLVLMDSAQLPRALADLDFAIINGNYVANQGEKISDGLVIEDSPPEHLVKVAIRAVNQDKPWAHDLKAAYESDAFEAYIRSDELFDGFIYPKAWQKESNQTDRSNQSNPDNL